MPGGLGHLEGFRFRMKMSIRRSGDRGSADHGWLRSRHTFSFAGYRDPRFMGFRSLRVINEDWLAPGTGFPAHPHRDMEIFSYVVQGSIQHQDSMGNGRILRPGQIQLMSAGTGVTHSESNPSSSEALHLLQIWIQPDKPNLRPGYTEWHPSSAGERSAKVLVISPDGRDGSAVIHQQADVYRIRLGAGETVTHALAPGRAAWFQLIRGEAEVFGNRLFAGDAASSEEAGHLIIHAAEPVEGLLFDLA